MKSAAFLICRIRDDIRPRLFGLSRRSPSPTTLAAQSGAPDIEREAVALVRERIGPVASFRTALVVAGLPKTRSGKTLRGTMRRIADGEDYPLPATIDGPAILDHIGDVLGRAESAGSRPA